MYQRIRCAYRVRRRRPSAETKNEFTIVSPNVDHDNDNGETSKNILDFAKRGKHGREIFMVRVLDGNVFVQRRFSMISIDHRVLDRYGI